MVDLEDDVRSGRGPCTDEQPLSEGMEQNRPMETARSESALFDEPVAQGAAPPRPRPYAVLAVVLLMGLFVAFLMHTSTEIVDDAYISFRYARNLALGHGLVFNPGERVEGYSNFSWVMIAAVFLRAGIDPTLAMPLVGASAALAAIAITARGARGLAAVEGRTHALSGAPAAAIVALAPTLAYYAGNGLETALVVMLYALAGDSVVRRRPVAFALAAAAACLTRPEAGLLAFVGFLVFALERPRRHALVVAAVGCGLVVPYLLWRASYYGSFLPNTLAAKPPSLKLGGLYVLRALPGMLGLLGAALSGSQARGRRALLALWGAHALGVVAEGGDWMPGERLLVPGLPWIAMAADGPLLALVRRPRRLADAWRPVLLAMALAYLPLSFRGLRSLAARNEYYAYWATVRGGTAHVLWNAGVRTVATVDIGLLGYVEPDLRVIDLAGLTDRVIASATGGNCDKIIPVAYLAERSPDAVLILAHDTPEAVAGGVAIGAYHYGSDRSLAESPWFRAHYRLRDWIRVTGTEVVYWFQRADTRGDSVAPWQAPPSPVPPLLELPDHPLTSSGAVG